MTHRSDSFVASLRPRPERSFDVRYSTRTGLHFRSVAVLKLCGGLALLAITGGIYAPKSVAQPPRPVLALGNPDVPSLTLTLSRDWIIAQLAGSTSRSLSNIADVGSPDLGCRHVSATIGWASLQLHRTRSGAVAFSVDGRVECEGFGRVVGKELRTPVREDFRAEGTFLPSMHEDNVCVEYTIGRIHVPISFHVSERIFGHRVSLHMSENISVSPAISASTSLGDWSSVTMGVLRGYSVRSLAVVSATNDQLTVEVALQ